MDCDDTIILKLNRDYFEDDIYSLFINGKNIEEIKFSILENRKTILINNIPKDIDPRDIIEVTNCYK